MQTHPIYYLILYITLFSMFLTLCIAATWNLVNMYFENRKNKQLLALLQDYIDGTINDKELVHKLLLMYRPRKEDERLGSMLTIDSGEAATMLSVLDLIVNRHKTDDIKKLEYKLWQYVNKEKASFATAD